MCKCGRSASKKEAKTSSNISSTKLGPSLEGRKQLTSFLLFLLLQVSMLLLLRLIDPVRWTLAIPIAVLVPSGMWWVLKRLLLIQLPSGLFGIG